MKSSNSRKYAISNLLMAAALASTAAVCTAADQTPAAAAPDETATIRQHHLKRLHERLSV